MYLNVVGDVARITQMVLVEMEKTEIEEKRIDKIIRSPFFDMNGFNSGLKVNESNQPAYLSTTFQLSANGLITAKMASIIKLLLKTASRFLKEIRLATPFRERK